MRWCFRSHKVERAKRERELAAAEAEVARIRVRADKVAESLKERLATNHWSEAVASIARKEH